MKFVLGKKLGMMQFFDASALRAIPATVIKVEQNKVTQVKTKEKDGYSAIQLGTNQVKKLNKALAGKLKDLGKFRYLREFRLADDKAEYNLGDSWGAEALTEGEKVQVTARSKGKGFAGVVKRHGFHGGPKTHGQKHSLRRPGSIGATTPQRVVKGTRMAGHLGAKQVTVKGLRVVGVNKDEGLLLLSGAVPGSHNSLIEIRTQK